MYIYILRQLPHPEHADGSKECRKRRCDLTVPLVVDIGAKLVAVHVVVVVGLSAEEGGSGGRKSCASDKIDPLCVRVRVCLCLW